MQQQPVNGLLTRPNSTDQQVFDHLKCEVLESQRQTLTNFLFPDRHMDFLRSRHVLSEEDCEEISHLSTRKKRASKLMDILEKKGAEAYDSLCAALKEEGTQIFLLRNLHENFEQRQRLYRELVGQMRPGPGLLDMSPPPLRPPPPPSSLNRHQGQGHGPDLRPTEDAYPGFFSQSHCRSSTLMDSSPGYVPSVCSCSSYAAPPPSCITTATDKEEGAKVIDLQKKRVNVPECLQNLSGRKEELLEKWQETCPQAGLRDLQTDTASLGRQSPVFLSTTATCGSDSSSASSNGSFPNSGPRNPAPTPTLSFPMQEQCDPGQPGQQRRYQRLSSRGSLQDIALVVSSHSERSMEPVEPHKRKAASTEPIEHEDMSLRADSPGSSGFFRSLDNASLAPSSPGVYPSDVPILCITALQDQKLALGKCQRACSEDGKERGLSGEARKEYGLNIEAEHGCVSPDTTDLSSQLSCISLSHCTARKMMVDCVAPPDSSKGQCKGEEKELASAAMEEKGSDAAAMEEKVPASAAMEEKVPASAAMEEKGSVKAGGDGNAEDLEFNKGISRETRISVCDKSGCSLHSTQC